MTSNAIASESRAHFWFVENDASKKEIFICLIFFFEASFPKVPIEVSTRELTANLTIIRTTRPLLKTSNTGYTNSRNLIQSYCRLQQQTLKDPCIHWSRFRDTNPGFASPPNITYVLPLEV
jgi:hypothetical protein